MRMSNEVQRFWDDNDRRLAGDLTLGEKILSLALSGTLGVVELVLLATCPR